MFVYTCSCIIIHTVSQRGNFGRDGSGLAGGSWLGDRTKRFHPWHLSPVARAHNTRAGALKSPRPIV